MHLSGFNSASDTESEQVKAPVELVSRQSRKSWILVPTVKGHCLNGGRTEVGTAVWHGSGAENINISITVMSG